MVSVSCLALCAGAVLADEVDDILALKARNRDRVKRFEAEYLTETTQPATVKCACRPI